MESGFLKFLIFTSPVGTFLSSSPYCVFLLQFAVRHLKELEHQKRELQKEGNALIDFFCEDKETMKLDECFQIFRDFCIRFNKAVKVSTIKLAVRLLSTECDSHSFEINAGPHGLNYLFSAYGTLPIWGYLVYLPEWLQQIAMEMVILPSPVCSPTANSSALVLFCTFCSGWPDH